MRRRAFITLIGSAAATSLPWPLTARAQPPAMPLVGVVFGVSAAEWADPIASWRRGLSETGFIEGRNVAVEYRWAEGRLERMPLMAADLIARRVAVLLMGGSTDAVRSVVAVAQTTPIVFTSGADPVEAGIVTSLNRPGGNVTGVTTVGGELGPKRLELLHEVVPGAKKIAVLINQNNRITEDVNARGVQAAAPRLGLEVIVLNGGTEGDIETAFASAVQRGCGGVYVSSDAFLNARRQQIAATALRHKLPTIGPAPDLARAGLLISYGADPIEMYRQAGVYVGRILKGEKAGDLPVLQPTKFNLIVNLKTAKAIGLTIPESFLLRADEVIE